MTKRSDYGNATPEDLARALLRPPHGKPKKSPKKGRKQVTANLGWRTQK